MGEILKGGLFFGEDVTSGIGAARDSVLATIHHQSSVF